MLVSSASIYEDNTSQESCSFLYRISRYIPDDKRYQFHPSPSSGSHKMEANAVHGLPHPKIDALR